MQLEFYYDKSGYFKPCIHYKKKGDIDWSYFDTLTENERKLLFMLFRDNKETKKIMDFQKSRGMTDRDELLKYIITRKFARLDRKWDIDESVLNFEA